MRPSTADIDRRKARIVASLRPTRVKRGFKTPADGERLGAFLGVSRCTLTNWENGDVIPPDKQIQAIERWLSSGPVWRYDRVDHIVGPQAWPEPLDVACETASQSRIERRSGRLTLGVGTNPVFRGGGAAIPGLNGLLMTLNVTRRFGVPVPKLAVRTVTGTRER